MGDVQPFQAIQKQFELTEVEERQLRNKLFGLRKKYIQQLWQPQYLATASKLQELEEEIDTLEHTLAHARVV